MSTFLPLTPWGGSVTLANATQAYSLGDLLDALPDGKRPGDPSKPLGSVELCVIQLDPAAGGAKLAIGSTALTTLTFCGSSLVAGQALPISSTGGLSLVQTHSIYLYSDTAGVQINVTLLRR